MAIPVEVSRDWLVVGPTIGAAIATAVMAFFTWRAIRQTREIQEDVRTQRKADERCRRISEIRDWASQIVNCCTNFRLDTKNDVQFLNDLRLRLTELEIKGAAARDNAVGVSDTIPPFVNATMDSFGPLQDSLAQTLKEIDDSKKFSAETAKQAVEHIGGVVKAASDVFVSATKALNAEKE